MKNLALVWDNFGPLHIDRVEAVTSHLSGKTHVFAIQHQNFSDTYSWETSDSFPFESVTLSKDKHHRPLRGLKLFFALMQALLKARADGVLLCHYEQWPVTLTAYTMRLMGRQVFLMGCPKFDDRERTTWREALKSLALLPYQGALVGSRATREFFEFLGMRGKPFSLGYNTVSIERIRRLSRGAEIAPFSDKDFVIIARLVPKKNIRVAIEAFGKYCRLKPDSTRRLHICGDGPLEGELRAIARSLDLESRVQFHGFLQSHELAPMLASAAALLLVSVEEQFGNVVPEALSLGIPVILSDVCGARYELLQSSVNGWLVEAENPDGIAAAMAATTASEAIWRQLSDGALAFASKGDVARFAQGVERLINHETAK